MKKECPPKCKENFLAVPEAILAIPFAQRCFLTIIKPSLGLLTIVHFSSSIVVRSSHTFLMKGTSVDFFSCLKECTMLMLEKWYDSVIEECADMFLLTEEFEKSFGTNFKPLWYFLDYDFWYYVHRSLIQLLSNLQQNL